MAGKVWLVGAGPSDVGLLTVKGKQVLEQAEVVVYDALVGAGIMALIPPEAERINAGKRASHHIIKQEITNQILLEKALEGKRVVRLKGGDPFLFGRGGEELELLSEHGVEYEVVPGVTSAISVPAYNGIPVTHRDYCSSVHIITGHQKADEPLKINFKALKDTGGTLVFLMGLTAVKNICAGLLEAGMSPDMPAAVLQKGTTSEQRAVVADLATLPERVKQAKIEPPAIIVVGKVCALHEKFAWFEKLPLFGLRVAVTRPRDRATTLSDRLRELGAQVIEMPTIRTVARQEGGALDGALDGLAGYRWIVFTSPAGVKIFMQALARRRLDVRALAGAKLAVIGTGTGKELEKYGLFADLVPETYDGDSLGIAMAEVLRSGDRVLIPRASRGNGELVRRMTAVAGVTVDDVAIYDTVYEEPTVDIVSEFNDHNAVAMFTSASTVEGFANSAAGVELTKVKALCIGRQTAAKAAAYGMKTYVAASATIDALIQLAIDVKKEV